MTMQDLTGEVAVITGAPSGIGEATVRLLVAQILIRPVKQVTP